MQRQQIFTKKLSRRAVFVAAGAVTAAAATPFPVRAEPIGGLSADARRSTVAYRVPDVMLRDRFDKPVRLAELLAPGKPVVVEFFFTSCPTICGLENATLAAAQARLTRINPDVRLVSVSIDPGYDTPARLLAYAQPFHPLQNWHFLTGASADIDRVMTAFDAHYPGGSKMLHQPLTFIRPQDGTLWRRVDGLLSADQLVAEYRDVAARPTLPGSKAGAGRVGS